MDKDHFDVHNGERASLFFDIFESARSEITQWAMFELAHQSRDLIGCGKHEAIFRHVDAPIIPGPLIDLA